jgi:hypothetical protein
MAGRRLRRFVGTWLLWQSLAMASPLLGFWTSPALVCECAHGDGATCPMHKHAGSPAQCAIRGAAPLDQSILLSFIESLSPTPPTVVIYQSSQSTPLVLGTEMTLDRPFSPDFPPPRV